MTFSKNALPTGAELEAAKQVPVYDAGGQQVLLGSLFEPDQLGGTAVVIFIRHFLCGLCEVAPVGQSLPPERGTDSRSFRHERSDTLQVRTTCPSSRPSSLRRSSRSTKFDSRSSVAATSR